MALLLHDIRFPKSSVQKPLSIYNPTAYQLCNFCFKSSTGFEGLCLSFCPLVREGLQQLAPIRLRSDGLGLTWWNKSDGNKLSRSETSKQLFPFMGYLLSSHSSSSILEKILTLRTWTLPFS